MPQHLEPQENGLTTRPSLSDPNRPAEVPREEPAFTVYLDVLCAPLEKLAPGEWTRDLRAEILSHLEALAEAYEELGETRDAAILQACRQLGDPHQQGTAWAERWQRKQPEPHRQTLRLAFSGFGRALLLSGLLLWLSMANNLHHPGWILSPGDLMRIVGVLVLPVIAGAWLGRVSRGRRVIAAATAISSLSLLTGILANVFPGDDPHGFRLFLWMMQVLYWLPIGVAATGFSGWFHTRLTQKRLLAK